MEPLILVAEAGRIDVRRYYILVSKPEVECAQIAERTNRPAPTSTNIESATCVITRTLRSTTRLPPVEPGTSPFSDGTNDPAR